MNYTLKARYNELYLSNERTCFSCGQEKKKLTHHHSIPQRIKPKRNVIIMVCHECHNKINKHDEGALIHIAYKAKKLTQESLGLLKRLIYASPRGKE